MKITFANNCNLKCWECSRSDCTIKQTFTLPDSMFYEIILNILKTRAGMELANGIPKPTVDQNLQKTAVSLKIARDICLDSQS